MKTVRRKDQKYEQLSSAKTGEDFSRSAVLSAALESKDFFIHQEVLAPGRRASAPHFHKQTDEFLYVLAGHPVIVEGGEELELAPGDCALFSAGSGLPHFIENRSAEIVELLVVGRRLSEPDVEYAREKV